MGELGEPIWFWAFQNVGKQVAFKEAEAKQP